MSNTLAYHAKLKLHPKKFYNIGYRVFETAAKVGQGANCIKTFFFVTEAAKNASMFVCPFQSVVSQNE
jgi:hypothetical protein